MAPSSPRIYLAGPEVFHHDARTIGRDKSAICAAAGCEGVFPLDTELELSGLPPFEQARRICLANEGLMRSCDAIIANLTPFRGVSMDAGTAFEVGFMRALGRPVFGYSNVSADYADRSTMFRRHAATLSFDLDDPALAIENFGLAENLMIDVAVSEHGAPVFRPAVEPASPMLTELAVFEACVQFAARQLLGPQQLAY